MGFRWMRKENKKRTWWGQPRLFSCRSLETRTATTPTLSRFIPSTTLLRRSIMTSSSSLPTVKPTTLGTSTINKSIPLSEQDAKWVGLKKLEWTDEDGKDRPWEMAARKTTSKGGVDGENSPHPLERRHASFGSDPFIARSCGHRCSLEAP